MTATTRHPERTERPGTRECMRDFRILNHRSSRSAVCRLLTDMVARIQKQPLCSPILDGAVLFLPSLFRNTFILRPPIKLRTVPDRWRDDLVADRPVCRDRACLIRKALLEENVMSQNSQIQTAVDVEDRTRRIGKSTGGDRRDGPAHIVGSSPATDRGDSRGDLVGRRSRGRVGSSRSRSSRDEFRKRGSPRRPAAPRRAERPCSIQPWPRNTRAVRCWRRCSKSK